MYFFQTRGFKIGLVIAAVVAVVLVVLFSEQIGNLLKFFGSKAEVGPAAVFNTWDGGTHVGTEAGADAQGDYATITVPETAQ
ncbi:TPA: hypothetical protein DHW58_00040 [Patescibacteria group bacterium]|uniref:Uncharacterized protein n=2 Tax=Bacteria division Kazan-3B-28 TaxID=1798534 RepID=A0A0G1ZGQ5_UNCK3|nr:MAG: hypothetical protein VE98_C0001G0406 [candidate division Kazan bacterium GW2011_GWA1_50_15]KKW25904.1 MAG: hypothetical protein VE99_C0001G0543 [candidate division Kazan bacterium GW2011_GWC1_52_13]KKW27082.1 MAG: hypothetical protein VF00_C0001G0017 [candidate division Kazan bacterium GW2011_GWB1_52_7]HAV65919.1 hypothetical protein [Patescibacteria group bacterium]HCL47373.1 hypothetical protein [Patescibacteria group bacterium]